MELNIRRLKVQCMLRAKFFGSLLHNCTLKESTKIPTACIDKRLLIQMNPEFMGTLNEDEHLFVLGHEVLHGALLHTHRIFEFADPQVWKVGNIAADYLVNFILVEMGFKKPDIVTWYDPKYNPTDYTLEKLTKELLDKQQQNQQQQQGDSGGKGNDKDNPSIIDGSDIIQGDGEPLTPKEKKELERKIKSSLAAAVMQAKKAGTLSGSLARMCDEMLKPKVNWRHELQDWFNVKIRGERSWSRPNRRMVARGIYMPVNVSLGCGHIGLAVDLSGSIGENEIKTWWSELKYIFATCQPSKVTICWFDTTSKIEVFDGGEIPEKLDVPNMGGGTDFDVPISFFNENEDDPITGLVFMTDMCGTWPKEPGYPVVILSSVPNHEGPWGTTIYCEMGEEHGS